MIDLNISTFLAGLVTDVTNLLGGTVLNVLTNVEGVATLGLLTLTGLLKGISLPSVPS
jgi:hypothetical protein